jgi:hypothetical protein
MKHRITGICAAAVLALWGAGLGEPLFAKELSEFQFVSRYEAGGETAAEIAAWHAPTRTAFVINGKDKTLDLVSLDGLAPGATLTAGKKLNLVKASKDLGVDFGDVTSVAVAPDGASIAVAVQDTDYTKPGCVIFLAPSGTVTSGVNVGVQPDMICFTPDATTLLVANEGEPRGGYAPGVVDPVGSVSIVRRDKGKPVATQIGFETFSAPDLLTKGVVLQTVRKEGTVTGHTAPALDLEPEYIAVSGDSRFAWVCLQEANAIAKLNIEEGRFEWIKGLPAKDHALPENALDLSEDTKAELSTYPVKGLLMPDSIAIHESDGRTYLVTANEGDGREWPLRPDGEPDEENPAFFKNELKLSKLKDEKIGGKLTAAQRELIAMARRDDSPLAGVTVHADAGLDANGTINALYTFGGRSFSILDAESLEMIHDSGKAFESHIAKVLPRHFNASNSNTKIDSRSAKKGPEPEGVVVVRHGTSAYAMVGLERVGGVMVYDITTPSVPNFVCYVNSRDYSDKVKGDSGPEGLAWVPAAGSPGKGPLLLVANEVSGTLAVYEAIEK